MKLILAESLLVAIVCALLALAANALSPKGLKLTRNYFPSLNHQPLTVASTNSSSGTNAASSFEKHAKGLREKGFQPIDFSTALAHFKDPRKQQDLIVFIDARDIRHFEEGHIPGAYQFDHFHPEATLPTILPVCQTAEKIIVYCTGGECEDSQFAAEFLREAGVPNEKLFIFVGGITEWEANSQPIERGSLAKSESH
jgi:rhodanese-related sulfurtransferase